MEEKRNAITVLGSVNHDYFFVVDRLPAVGETLSAKSMMSCCGGKGANQASTIGKQNYKVNFVAQVGSDSAMKRILIQSASGQKSKCQRPGQIIVSRRKNCPANCRNYSAAFHVSGSRLGADIRCLRGCSAPILAASRRTRWRGRRPVIFPRP